MTGKKCITFEPPVLYNIYIQVPTYDVQKRFSYPKMISFETKQVFARSTLLYRFLFLYTSRCSLKTEE